jgi:lactose/cellobiose-specific phosphotransferase system IIC component
MNLSKYTDLYLDKISNNKVISAIRCGLLYIVPMVMVGSFVLMILNLPIPAFQNFMNNTFGVHWRNTGLAIYKGTFDIMSLAAVISIAYAYAQSFKSVSDGLLSPFYIILCALCSYFTFNPVGEILIPANDANSSGLLTAIIVAIVSTGIYVFLFDHIRSKKKVYSYDSDSLLMDSLRNITPLFITLAIFGLMRILFDIFHCEVYIQAIVEKINGAFSSQNGGLAATVTYILVIQILWFFGIHGTNVLDSLAKTLFVSASAVNISLAMAGSAPTEIITKEFLDAFVFMGGAGCTLGLLIALLISGENSNGNRVAKYSLLPGIFNINETITYGLPIIFNPYYLIPFAMSPIVISIISYIAFRTGLVPLTAHRVEWPTPILLSGYVSTGSIAGSILQLVNLSVSVVIYLPFVKLYEKHIIRSNQKLFQELTSKLMSSDDNSVPEKVLERSDSLGSLARLLVSELEQAIDNPHNTALQLHYQPKVTSNGKVHGAEALLRWFHPKFGYLPPPIVIALCDEAGLVNKLGRWVIKTAYYQLADWNKLGHKNLSLSVNLMPKQLKEDSGLLDYLHQIIDETGILATNMEMELTENEAIDQSISTKAKLEKVRAAGINLSIDDFGMGNSSLLYIRDSYINIIKIDISLVHSVTTNHQSQEIIRSIISLCEQVDIDVVAEGVETLQQMEKLEEMGCHLFQGFLFSKALPSEDFVEYVKIHGCVR